MALGFHYAVILPFVGALVTLLALVEAVRGSGNARKLAIWGFTLIALGWLVYMIPFATLDYRLAEVAKNANDDLPFIIRVSTAWAGGGGSLYLYTTLIALAGLYALRKGEATRAFTISITGVTLVAFASAVLNGAFDVVEGVGGFGLNPLLKSYWIVPHPLTTFGGYALLMAASLILLYTPHTRAGYAVFLTGWGLLTFGIMFGAYWSYETFGWGGYWAWDPVEVAELTVWLAATGVLHSIGPLRSLQRPMLHLTASSGFLAPFVTRSGLSPLHSFAAADLGAIVLLASALIFLVLASYTLAGVIVGAPHPRELVGRLRRMGLANVSIVAAGLALIAMAIFVYASLLAPSVSVALERPASIPTMAEGIRFYHPVLYPLFVFSLLWIPGYFLAREFGSKGFTGYIATTLIAAAVLAVGVDKGVILPQPQASLSTNYQVVVGLAVSSMALGALLVSLARYLIPRERRKLLRDKALATRDLGLRVLHLGMIIAFIGVLLSGTYAFNDTYFQVYTVKPGEYTEAGSVNITVVSYRFAPHQGTVDLYSHVAGKRTTAFVAWQGLSLLRIDVAPAVQEVIGVMEEVRVNRTMAAIANLVVNETSVEAEGNYSFTATANIELVDMNMGTSQVIAKNTTLNMTIRDPLIFVDVNPIVDDNGILVGAWVDVGIAPTSIILYAEMNGTDTVAGIHSYYLINLTSPVTLQIAGKTLEIIHMAVYTTTQVNETHGVGRILDGGVELYNPYLIVLNGSITSLDTNVPIPYLADRGFYLYIVVERGEAVVLEHILESSLREALADPLVLARIAGQNPGEIPLPRDALSGISLDVTLEIISSEPIRVTDRIRFEANGEAAGIHGLVTPAVIVRDGFSDIYISVQPPMVDGYFDRYHEPMLYYLHEANKRLPYEERLALSALMAAGYNIAEVQQLGHIEGGLIAEQGLLDLYLHSEDFDPTNSTINTQGLILLVKVVPGVNLVWLGTSLMGAAGIVLGLVYAFLSRRS